MTSDLISAAGQPRLVDLRGQGEDAAAEGARSARRRLDLLLDAESFVEHGRDEDPFAAGLPVDGVITGTGLVAGRPVCVLADGPTVPGASGGADPDGKLRRILETAYRTRVPMLYLLDAAGGRSGEHLDLTAPAVRRARLRANGSIPQVCGLFGPAVITGLAESSDVVLRARGVEDGVSQGELPSEVDILALMRRHLSYLPDSFEQDPPATGPVPAGVVDLRAPAPVDAALGRHLTGLLDEGSFLTATAFRTGDLVVGYARLGGQVIGVLGDDPRFPEGERAVGAADRAARFVRTCEAFNLPLLLVSDVPRLLADASVEAPEAGSDDALLVAAVGAATVPTISVILRQVGGGGLQAMLGPGFAPDVRLALGTAGHAVTGAAAAVEAGFARRTAALTPAERALLGDEVVGFRGWQVGAPVVDAVVEPADLRAELIRRFAGLRDKDRSFSRDQTATAPV